MYIFSEQYLWLKGEWQPLDRILKITSQKSGWVQVRYFDSYLIIVFTSEVSIKLFADLLLKECPWNLWKPLSTERLYCWSDDSIFPMVRPTAWANGCWCWCSLSWTTGRGRQRVRCLMAAARPQTLPTFSGTVTHWQAWLPSRGKVTNFDQVFPWIWNPTKSVLKYA